MQNLTPPIDPQRVPEIVKLFIGLVPKLIQLTILGAISLVLLPIYWLRCLIWYLPFNDSHKLRGLTHSFDRQISPKIAPLALRAW